MKTTKNTEHCHACGGTMKPGTTTFTVDFGHGVVVVRNVPAMVCSKCGMEFIDDDNAQKIEEIVNNAKAKNSVVEVMSLSPLSA